MHRSVILVFAIIVGAANAAGATPTASPDPIAAALIPPDLIMAHQAELGLSDTQKRAIQGDLQDAQQRFTHLQWQLSATVEHLVATLKQPHVDEQQAMRDLHAEQSLEHDIKATQLRLMIRVKNELTPDQQAKARTLAGTDR